MYGGVYLQSNRLPGVFSGPALRWFVLVAILFCCLSAMPASAAAITPKIQQGGTVYIGEDGLNLTRALNQAHGQNAYPDGIPALTGIGWWPSAATVSTTSPTRTLSLQSRYRSFAVVPADFVGYTGNWYLLDQSGMADLSNGGIPRMVIQVSDPSLDIAVWDFDQNNEVSGLSVPQGERIGFKIKTNMYNALDNRYRRPVTYTSADGYINIIVKDECGATLTALAPAPNTVNPPLAKQAIRSQPYFWPAQNGTLYWATGAKDVNNQYRYPAGTYSINTVSTLNHMRDNYKLAGADYTGKTVSPTYTLTLIPDAVRIEANKDSVVRGNRLSVTITGRPLTRYYLWVKNNGSTPLPVTTSPPTFLPSAPVIQDRPSGPYTIGSHKVLNGGSKTVRGSVPPSTRDKTLHYVAVITNKRGTATAEIQTWNTTRPSLYTFHVESTTRSSETSVLVMGGNIPVSPAGISPAKVIRNPRINTAVATTNTADYRRILQGASVFIGEEGLNVTAALNQAHGNGATPYKTPASTKIGWWASSAIITTTSPTKVVDLNLRHAALTVEPADFIGYTGNWYLVNPVTGMADLSNGGVPQVVFSVQDPALDIRIWDLDTNADITGKSVPQGERLGFRIDTNMYLATDTTKRPDISGKSPGFITIKVKNENGATYNYLYQPNSTTIDLTNQFVSVQPFFWGMDTRHNIRVTPSTYAYWRTDLRDSEYRYFYPQGTYVVFAESQLNRMMDNYKCAGADYTGKTVSQSYTVALVTDRVTVETNKDSVVAGNPFAVTVIGRPNSSYYLWLYNTRSLNSSYKFRPPMIATGQEKVYLDKPADAALGFHPLGNYAFRNGNGRTIFQDVGVGTFAGGNQYNRTRYYARIVTSSSGVRTVEFVTSTATRAQKYTVRVEQFNSGEYKGGETTVKVTTNTAYNASLGVSAVSVNQTELVSGTTPVSAAFDVSFGRQYPADEKLRFSTGLASPRWSYTIIIDGVEHYYPAVDSTSLDLTGGDISYPPNRTIRLHIGLNATAPSVSTATNKTLFGITQVDAQGYAVPGNQYIRTILIRPHP